MGTNLLGGQDLLPLTLIGKKLVGTSPPPPRFFIRSGGSDYSQEMHNYKYKLTYFLAFKSLLLCFDDFFLFHDGHP